MPIKKWLANLDLLEQYQGVFKDYTGVEDILHLTEANIKDMGVKNSSHRARIMSSLTALKEKYECRKLFFFYCPGRG